MENTQKRKISGTGWVMIVISLMILFTCGFLTALVGIDYGPHEEIALSLTPGDPIGLFKAHPEPLWHLMTYGVVHLLRCRVEIAAGIVSGLLVILTYCIAFAAIRRTVPGLESHEIAGLDLVLHLAGAVYVPFFNKEPYLGQGTPNIWHNPTTIAVRPIALLIFVLVASMVIKAQKEEFENSIPAGKAVLTGFLLILSCLAKPSFVQVFYPAIFTLMVVWLIMYKGKNLRTAVQLMLMCLPSLAVMILQFVLAFYGGNSKSGGITIAPFVVAGARTPSIPISMLLLLALDHAPVGPYLETVPRGKRGENLPRQFLLGIYAGGISGMVHSGPQLPQTLLQRTDDGEQAGRGLCAGDNPSGPASGVGTLLPDLPCGSGTWHVRRDHSTKI